MALPMPILERITENIVEALGGVTVAVYGYQLDARRPRKHDRRPLGDRSAVVYLAEPERVGDDPTRTEGAEDLTRWLQPFWIAITIREGQASQTPIDQLYTLVMADAWTELAKDPSRGGLAITTKLREPIFPADEESTDVVIMRVDVLYAHLWNDPRKTGRDKSGW